jgi:hypothetical protein
MKFFFTFLFALILGSQMFVFASEASRTRQADREEMSKLHEKVHKFMDAQDMPALAEAERRDARNLPPELRARLGEKQDEIDRRRKGMKKGAMKKVSDEELAQRIDAHVGHMEKDLIDRHKETISKRVDHLWDRAKSASFSPEEKLTLRERLDTYKDLEVSHLHDRLASKRAFHQLHVQDVDLWENEEEDEEEEDEDEEGADFRQIRERVAEQEPQRLAEAKKHEETQLKIRTMRREIEQQIREKERS